MICLITEGYDVVFDIAGEWDSIRKTDLVASMHNPEKVRFVGVIESLASFLEGAAIYLHTARGDAWGITVNEAMQAGIVPIVSGMDRNEGMCAPGF
ncbi:MAG: glycosyltransferase family 4 protein [Cyclobacteriaceae bacterium]|nr:glycosyltransferase family 4 protein [Cyclobacteriaceae bacterium]